MWFKQKFLSFVILISAKNYVEDTQYKNPKYSAFYNI